MSDVDEGLRRHILLDHIAARHGASSAPWQVSPRPMVADDGTITAQSFQRNPRCGDEVSIRLRLEHDTAGFRVTELTWWSEGCDVSAASASVLSQRVAGEPVSAFLSVISELRAMLSGPGVRSRTAVRPLDEDRLGDAIAFAGIVKHPSRIACAMLPWIAAEQALVAVSADRSTNGGSDRSANATALRIRPTGRT